MKKKHLILIFSLLIFSQFFIFTQELAVTIDDLPFVSVGTFSDEEKSQMFNNILSALRTYNIKIIGFVIGRSLTPENKNFLDQLIKEGHLIGNHTYSHPDLNKIPINKYQQDISLGMNTIKKWSRGNKYFRYPMLHRGNTQIKHDTITDYLKKNDYTVVPVTIDNDEWMFNRDYVKAVKVNDLKKARDIGLAYLEHMKVETNRYVDLAQKKLGSSVKHILLIHMNAINSVYLKDLLAWYRNQGWKFITVSEALRDPVYSKKDHYIGKWGWSWLRRINPQRLP